MSKAATERPVDAIADRFVEEYAALDPVATTESGILGHEDRLTDLSPDGFAERHDLLRRTLARAREATQVDQRERAAKDAFLERLGVQVEGLEAGIPRSEVSVIASGVHGIRSCFDLMDTSSVQGCRHIDARLARVSAALSGYRRTLLDAARRGHVSARRQYAEVAAQLRRRTGQGATASIFTTLVGAAPEGPLRNDLERHAAESTDAVAEFGRFLAEGLLLHGRERDAVGRERYELASRYFMGAAIDLEETYAGGWEELRRIEREMLTIVDGFVPGGSIDDAARMLDADPGRYIEGKEAFRDWMQELTDRTVSELAGSHLDIPEPIRRIECRIAQTCLRSDLLNRWQRHMCWVSGSGEGWALYAERLIDELGYLSEPADKLGMLDGQALRAARVVTDIGMHLELKIPKDNSFGFHPGETWTPELGHKFMRAHSRMDDATLRFEVNRYLGWPGQAPSYKVGERLWLQAREAAKDRHGDAFGLQTFHRKALDLGSIGLDPLTEALERL